MANNIDIVIPDLGDFADVEVIEILVKTGDRVAREDGLITLETDKAAMDVPAPKNGVVESLSVQIGDTVSSGDVIGKMSVEISDTVVIRPAIAAPPTGETTLMAAPIGDKPKSGGKQTLVVPDLGDFEDVEIIEVHVSQGDVIQIEDPIVTLETDKAAMDVPAVVAGRIDSVLVNTGDKVSEGSSLAIIDAVATQVAPQPAKAPPTAPARPPASPAAVQQAPLVKPGKLPAIDEAGFARAHASPSVRKLARELGVDLAQVNGSGLKTRILHDDVKAFVKAILTGQAAAPAGGGLPKTPVIDFSKFGEIDVQPLTRIQKISGPRLQASWVNLPHVTQHDLADITKLEAHRQKLKESAQERGIRLPTVANGSAPSNLRLAFHACVESRIFSRSACVRPLSSQSETSPFSGSPSSWIRRTSAVRPLNELATCRAYLRPAASLSPMTATYASSRIVVSVLSQFPGFEPIAIVVDALGSWSTSPV